MKYMQIKCIYNGMHFNSVIKIINLIIIIGQPSCPHEMSSLDIIVSYFIYIVSDIYTFNFYIYMFKYIIINKYINKKILKK